MVLTWKHTLAFIVLEGAMQAAEAEKLSVVLSSCKS